MRGLKRLTYFVNRMQAQDDYRQLAGIARANGAADLADQYEPGPNASLKQIDQAISDLRHAYQVRLGINPYVTETD